MNFRTFLCLLTIQAPNNKAYLLKKCREENGSFNIEQFKNLKIQEFNLHGVGTVDIFDFDLSFLQLDKSPSTVSNMFTPIKSLTDYIIDFYKKG